MRRPARVGGVEPLGTAWAIEGRLSELLQSQLQVGLWWLSGRVSVDLGVGQVDSWHGVLAGLHARFGSRLARSEPRGRALEYMAGLMAPLERNDGWSLAERAGEVHPIGVQRLLGDADWDADGVRDDVRDFIVESIGDKDAVLIGDDTGI